MSKSDFDGIVAGLEQAVAISQGHADPAKYRVHVPTTLDVAAMRKRLGLSQAAFATRFGFPVSTLQDWEQGRRRPAAAAKVLLTIIDREPEAVERALTAA